jgi:putative iron-regulated protein
MWYCVSSSKNLLLQAEIITVKNNFMKHLNYLAIAGVALTVSLASCSKDGCTNPTAVNYDSDAEDDDGSCSFLSEVTKAGVKTNYADVVYASYEDSYNEAVKLQSSVDAFLANKTEANFEACKTAWLTCRIPYGQTEAFRFAGGPIDSEDGLEGAMNAWPLDENYVDYVLGAPNAGIINDGVTDLSESNLESKNEQGGEKNISIGYHAIEFLLWGQDDADASKKTPGQRSYTDYLTSGGTNSNQERRSTYLKAVTDLLVKHLLSVKSDWDPAISGNYASTFVVAPDNEVFTNLFASIGILSKSELATERIFVALDNKDQEDEHSCFADNTYQDIVLNAKGIQNVYLGSYKRVDGTVVSGSSLYQLLAEQDYDLAEKIKNLCAESVAKAEAIPQPFDYALTLEDTGGNGPIMQTVNSLQSLGDELANGAAALGLTINTELPE